MDKNTLKAIVELAEGNPLGMLIVGVVLSAEDVPAGVSKATGRAYDAFRTAKVETSRGESISIKLVDVDLPVRGKLAAFRIDRAWVANRVQGAQSSYWVQ